MATKTEILSDIQLQLLQSAPTDDSELELSQIAFWVDQFLNALVTNEINSKLIKSEQIPSIYIKRESCIVGEVEDTECSDDCEDRIFVELEEDVLTLNKDWGIIRVETSEGDTIRFAKPSENNLLYSRQGTKIFIEGIKEPDLNFDKINVWYVPKQNVSTLSDSDEVLVSDLVLPQLIQAVVEVGRHELYGTQADVSQDGQDVKSQNYHTAISNVDQPTE
jgi:hypothetical protein